MEILRDFKQISEKVKKIFDIDVSNVPILDSISKADIKDLVDGAKINASQQEINNLAELIFQLNEYVPALCNFVKIFLQMKYYQGIIYFLDKLFVAHVGMANYNSKNMQYSHRERYFDRFIEVAKSTDLTVADILPFIFAIIKDNDKTELSVWLAPALEYMQNVYRENNDVVKEFIANNKEYQATYFEMGLEFNTQNAIYEIFNTDTVDEKLISRILKHYYTDVMNFFDKNLENSGAKKFHYVKILAGIEKPEVTARLEDLYEEEKDETIKAFIKTKLGIADKSNLGCSPKHFETMALKKVENPQERTLGVPFEKMQLRFNDESEANNTVKTYLINIFKEERDLLNLYGLSDVKTLFNNDDLNNFAEKLFYSLKRSKDIKEAKWALRFISLVCKDSLEDEVYYFIQDLYKQKRFKEAIYFIQCLVYSKKEKIINLFSKLAEDGEGTFENKDYLIALYCEVMSRSRSDVLDMLVNDDVNSDTIEVQKERLYRNFIANKSYTREQFDTMFVNKKVFNELAQNLVFGEYKFERLFALFVLVGEEKKYIAGTRQEDDKDLRIKIAHSLDLDERFEEAKRYFPNPTFIQFGNTFPIKDSEKTQTKVGSMHGVLINSVRFTGNMTKFGFIKNVNDEDEIIKEMIHISPELNLLAEVSFETPITSYSSTSSIGSIRFYKLNQCLKNNKAYIINKANAVALNGVEPRYYDFVLNCVSKSIRN